VQKEKIWLYLNAGAPQVAKPARVLRTCVVPTAVAPEEGGLQQVVLQRARRVRHSSYQSGRILQQDMRIRLSMHPLQEAFSIVVRDTRVTSRPRRCSQSRTRRMCWVSWLVKYRDMSSFVWSSQDTRHITQSIICGSNTKFVTRWVSRVALTHISICIICGCNTPCRV